MTRSPLRAFAVVFVVAFAVRCVMLLYTPPEYVGPVSPNEPGRVAQSLVQSGQYADPYLVPTGPTAHPLPVYTGLVALLFEVFGVTMTAGYVRCLLNIAATSAMLGLTPWLASRLGAGAPAGLIGGLAGALFPYQGLEEILNWAGSESFAAVAFGVLLVALVGRWTSGRGTLHGAFLIGIGWGAAFHLAPALLLVMLGCLAFELLWSREPKRWRAPVVMALGAALACAPWALRNYAAFREVFFVRSNFGLELRLGNHEGSAATWAELSAREGRTNRHPCCNPAEALKVQQMGEMAYMGEARAEATTWIRANPGAFLRLTAQRVAHVWLGPLDRSPASAWLLALTVLAFLGAWRLVPALAAPQRAALLIPMALFPLVYYVVPYLPRYRAPLDWILLTLAGTAVWRWTARPETEAVVLPDSGEDPASALGTNQFPEGRAAP
jgi:hypothetical protein